MNRTQPIPIRPNVHTSVRPSVIAIPAVILVTTTTISANGGLQ